MGYEVHCDLDKSFRIVDPATGKTVALVKCNRTDTADNKRGLKIAEKMAAADELLHALRLMIPRCDCEATCRACNTARAAIDKADGKE